MIITQEITLDLCYENCFKTIIVKQLDENSRYLKVNVTERGKKYTVPDESFITFNVKRSDDQAKRFSGILNEDGTITIPLPNWMLLEPGKHTCNVSIVNGDTTLSTLNFVVYSELAPCTDEDIKDDEDYGILVELFKVVKEAGESATISADAAADSAKSAANAAEAAVSAADALSRTGVTLQELEADLKLYVEVYIKEHFDELLESYFNEDIAPIIDGGDADIELATLDKTVLE